MFQSVFDRHAGDFPFPPGQNIRFVELTLTALLVLGEIALLFDVLNEFSHILLASVSSLQLPP